MTTLGVGLDSLGIDTINEPANVPQVPQYKSTLERGSTLAHVLMQIFEGTPVTIVPAPPGAGKSKLIADLCYQMHTRRSDFKIVIAAPTKVAAGALARSVHEALGTVTDEKTGQKCAQVAWEIFSLAERPDELESTVKDARVTIMTVAAAANRAPECDLMLIDEAWQTIVADVVPAADRAAQLVMVGDSGQIGPVITFDTAPFTGSFAPHLQAPEAFATLEHAKTLNMTRSFRLGQDTVQLLQPMYDFEFTSARPDRHLVHKSAGRLPEIVTEEFAQTDTPDDPVLLDRVVRHAIGFIGSTVVQGDQVITLTENDVAIVAAHNVQCTSLIARLKAAGYPNILAGTADKLQGSQRHAVVALDPLAGQEEASGHHVSLGRACVMASRHMTHMTWLYPHNWEALLDRSEEADAQQCKEFHQRLIAQGSNEEQ